jgi:hypothetical protein
MSDVSDRFDTGGGFNIGMIIEAPATPLLGIQFEYGFNDLTGEERRVPLAADALGSLLTEGIIESNHTMHYLNFNGLLKTPGTSFFNAYAVGGGGMYYRSVSLTTPDVGYTTFCDPYWYACYPTYTEIDRVIGDRSSWDPGLNVGGGITMALGDQAQFYVETRWHYMWGPEVTDLDGVTRNANGQYLPVTFGFRF